MVVYALFWENLYLPNGLPDLPFRNFPFKLHLTFYDKARAILNIEHSYVNKSITIVKPYPDAGADYNITMNR